MILGLLTAAAGSRGDFPKLVGISGCEGAEGCAAGKRAWGHTDLSRHHPLRYHAPSKTQQSARVLGFFPSCNMHLG